MKLIISIIVIFLSLASNTCSQKKEEIQVNSSEVCCETFGYGAMMIKCCQSYKVIPADQCKVPLGLVGGGKQIVDMSFCKKK